MKLCQPIIHVRLIDACREREKERERESERKSSRESKRERREERERGVMGGMCTVPSHV